MDLLTLKAHERFDTGQGRIEQVTWASEQAENEFFVRARDRLTLWSATHGQSPLRTIVSGGGDLRELATCQTDPCRIAYVLDRKVHIYDVRSGQVALSFPSEAHLIRWNPFIPYWLATASNFDDANGIGIYDLRYQSEGPIVNLPVRFTTDLCWSNANCELLLSSSSSRILSLWGIREEANSDPQPIAGLSCGQHGGEISSLAPSLRHPNIISPHVLAKEHGVQFSIPSLTFCCAVLLHSSPSSADSGPGQDPRLTHIERSLYCRDFEAVFKGLLDFASSTSPSQFESLQRLSNQTLPMLPISTESWSVGCLDEGHLAVFWNDLAKYSQGIPPNFYLRISEQPGAVEEVRFKVRVLEAIRHGDVGLLAKLTSRILNMVKADNSFLDHPTLVSIVGVLLSGDRLGGLVFGRQVLDLMISNGASNHLGRSPLSGGISGDACALCHLLLFPTIFDTEAISIIPSSRNSSPSRLVPEDRLGPKAKSSVTAILGDEVVNAKNRTQSNTEQRKALASSNPHSPASSSRQLSRTTTPRLAPGRELLALRKFILQPERARAMVDLEIALERVTDDQEKYMETLIRGLQNGLEGKTAAARTTFKYLEYLRDASQLESYLTILIPYCRSPRTDFAYALLEHVDRHVMPSLKYALSQAIDTHRPSLVLRALLLIVLLVDGRRPLPDDLGPFLADRLRRLLRALQAEDYSRMPGYGRLVKAVMSLTRDGTASNSDGELWRQVGLLKDYLRSSSTI